MKEIAVEDLAYLIKQAKRNGQPQPIFFLGAGASKTGNIPLAGEIEKKILTDFQDNPFIKKLADKDKIYAKLLDCLSPHDRNELLKQYINQAKINVTHIYLAQLLRNDFIDYVLTVNFDNLMLRALALYNEFPPTYDMAILKDLTTTSFKEKSIVYLHGQHHGLWLLNTPEEMNKVKATVPRIFDSIKNKRPWVFIGYSGSDPIFEHVLNLGRFDNGLYWVTYKDHLPKDNVQAFIRKANTNAAIIKGYDSDSFMLKLNEELDLPQPKILDKPFSSLHEMLNEIVDVNEEDHFKGVKERLEIAKGSVEKAIAQFEEGKIKKTEDFEKDLEVNTLKKKIIDISISEEYDEKIITELAEKAELIRDESVNELLADLYFNWGNELGKQSRQASGSKTESLLNKTFEKYDKSLALKPDQSNVLYNFGGYLGDLARIKKGEESKQLYYQSIEKLNQSSRLEPDVYHTIYTWGNYLWSLANLERKSTAESLYNEAIDKFKQSLIIKPNDSNAFTSWGKSLGSIGDLKIGEEAKSFYYQAIQKTEQALELNPDNYDAFHDLGIFLGNLARLEAAEAAESLYEQAIENFERALSLNPNDGETLYALGGTIIRIADVKSGAVVENLYDTAFETLKKAVEFGANPYNLACLYALRGKKEKALNHLEQSLEIGYPELDFVLQDEDWKSLLDDDDFKSLIRKYSKTPPH